MVVSWCRGPRLSWPFNLVSGTDHSFSTWNHSSVPSQSRRGHPDMQHRSISAPPCRECAKASQETRPKNVAGQGGYTDTGIAIPGRGQERVSRDDRNRHLDLAREQISRHLAGWSRAGWSTVAASAVSAARATEFPPVCFLLALLARPLEHQRRPLPCASTGATERPELLGRSHVVMNQLVQVERVDFPSVHLREAIADVIEEETQLLLVILGDHLPCRAATRLFVLDISDPDTFGHTRNLPRALACAHPAGGHLPWPAWRGRSSICQPAPRKASAVRVSS